MLKITIDREQVVVKKAKKETPVKKETSVKGKAQNAKLAPAPPKPGVPAATATTAAPDATAASQSASAAPLAATAAPADATAAPPSEATATASSTTPATANPAVAGTAPVAPVAAEAEAERPADPASVTFTESPLHAANVLRGAIDRIFAVGIDDRLKAAMPGFWQLYYQAVAEKADYSPKDPAVMRQNAVDKKAKLLSVFQPDSNEYAQADAVSGMALYHTVIGADGKPQEIAVARPIGFGLDENAVASIRKASFEPATKDGKPVPGAARPGGRVPHLLEANRGGERSCERDPAGRPTLPGPYSLHQP